jgi:hypothetical protein
MVAVPSLTDGCEMCRIGGGFVSVIRRKEMRRWRKTFAGIAEE